CCLIEEPVVLREKLYKYRIHGSNTALESHQVVVEETTVVIRDHLRRILSQPSANKWVNMPEEHGFFLGGPGWCGMVGSAFDMLLERSKRLAQAPARHLAGKGVKDTGERVTILSHDMSQTGAPTIVLELACALADKGVKVNVLTQSDGPLRHEFNRLGFSVAVIRQVDGLQRLYDRLQQKFERRVWGWRLV